MDSFPNAKSISRLLCNNDNNHLTIMSVNGSSPSSRDNRGKGQCSERVDLPSYRWKEQLDNSRSEEDFASSIAKGKKQNSLSKVLKLLKAAEGDKMVAQGKRVPLGDVSSNTNRTQNMINLQRKGESRRVLNKIQSKLPELC